MTEQKFLTALPGGTLLLLEHLKPQQQSRDSLGASSTGNSSLAAGLAAPMELTGKPKMSCRGFSYNRFSHFFLYQVCLCFCLNFCLSLHAYLCMATNSTSALSICLICFPDQIPSKNMAKLLILSTETGKLVIFINQSTIKKGKHCKYTVVSQNLGENSPSFSKAHFLGEEDISSI